MTNVSGRGGGRKPETRTTDGMQAYMTRNGRVGDVKWTQHGGHVKHEASHSQVHFQNLGLTFKGHQVKVKIKYF